MMRNLKNFCFLIFPAIVLIISGNPARADLGNARQFSAKVQVSISADESIKSQVDSYIKRELRSLQDVTLVDEGADWELNIIAMEVSTKAGYKSGIVLSVIIISPFKNQIVSEMFQEKYKDFGATLTKDLYRHPDHWLRAGPNDQLRSLCVELIADFDSKIIEEVRRQYREIIKIMESSSPN